MENTAQFFDRVLALECPWYVGNVLLDLEKQVVELEIEVRKGWRWRDSKGRKAHVHAWEQREWRHRDMMEFETRIRAKVPRLKCEDNTTEMASVPWAEKYARWTLSFEAHAIKTLESCSSLEAGRRLLKLDWSSVHRLMERAVDRGMKRREIEELRYIGVDEKNFRRGHSYVTLATDLNNGRVLEVGEGKDTEAVVKVLQSLPKKLREGICAAAADMSPAIARGIHRELKNVEVVHDKFHVSKILGEAVDKVRREEAKKLALEGDERLKNTRYLWLYAQNTMPKKHLTSFEYLAQSNLKTSRAWLCKENFGGFWIQGNECEGRQFFKEWFATASRSKLKPIKRVAHTLKNHLQGLLGYFSHRITNAVSEGLNSKIQALKHAARGFATFESYRIRILFYCGKLSLYPAPYAK